MNSKAPLPSPVDYYAILQIHRRAGTDVIKAAYQALMFKHRFESGSSAIAQSLTQALRILSDPNTRAQYDTERNQLSGKIIGGFRVIKKIAEGGFGKTYEGAHILTGEPVCIKHCSEISPESETILIEEAKAMWDLRHFSFPAVRDLVRLDDDSLALVMSFIKGPTLAQIIEKYGRMDAEHVAWITHRILNALMYLHVHGIVHGDIKPQNIIVQPLDRTVVLIDFGLAMIKPKRGDESKGYTDHFAPPEQLAGKVLIPESDLYSLGMTMIYALCGGVAERLATRSIPTSVPEPLSDFISRVTARQPLDRPRVWEKENLYEEFEKIRINSFGHAHSGGTKPLNIDL
jgi:serine/threonine protein kinase